MDITQFIVSLREKALLYGDYATYRSQLTKKLLNSRKKLNIATKSRGKFHPKAEVTAEQIASNHEYLHLQLLTAERAWAHALSMKAAHSADNKGITSKTRSHIVSRLQKASQSAESLADVLVQSGSGASSIDILEARAYAALLKGSSFFERQNWNVSLKNYSVARIIYSALSASGKEAIFKDLLSETIDPSIRYAAYQVKIPRTEPIPTIARKVFPHDDQDLVDRLNQLDPNVLEHGDHDAKKGQDGAPTTLAWRSREVKIEDAAIALAWGSVQTAKIALREKLSASATLHPKDQAAAYDDILIATQDAVDATKQAMEELKSEGVSQSDPRMQSLQITRTAVNFEMISWRIGRNRMLAGEGDGAIVGIGANSRRKKAKEGAPEHSKDNAPGRQIARLKEKVVLYDGNLQSIESIVELPGVANDQELSARLEATSKYFAALKSLAIARSYAIAGNTTNALALTKHAHEQVQQAGPVLASGGPSGASPRDISVTKEDAKALFDLLSGELQQSHALVEISNLRKPKGLLDGKEASKPLIERLSEYPSSGVDLENIVAYPPKLEPIPVKPMFLDVAFNYIDYPDNQAKQTKPVVAKEKAAPEPEGKPQKRGWFGFGR
ncbi:hypothetical protein GQ53DRAFT_736546 [Thozetella sp. PMI_491]|nr:hypothetical protein GQ53DRAFT_736546 [Thozetella sp. PMI_491]